MSVVNDGAAWLGRSSASCTANKDEALNAESATLHEQMIEGTQKFKDNHGA